MKKQIIFIKKNDSADDFNIKSNQRSKLSSWKKAVIPPTFIIFATYYILIKELEELKGVQLLKLEGVKTGSSAE